MAISARARRDRQVMAGWTRSFPPKRKGLDEHDELGTRSSRRSFFHGSARDCIRPVVTVHAA